VRGDGDELRGGALPLSRDPVTHTYPNFDRRPICSGTDAHGPPLPRGYLEKHNEANRRRRAGWTQSRCERCGHWGVWAKPEAKP